MHIKFTKLKKLNFLINVMYLKKKYLISYVVLFTDFYFYNVIYIIIYINNLL
jgi:hypothetical protein